MTIATLQIEFTSCDIALRPIIVDDSLQIWKWRNDPEVRAISFAADRIEWDAHQSWLQKKLEDSACLWLIADHVELGCVGHIRFDVVPEQEALVAVTVAPTLRGRGLGKILINRGVREAFAKLPIDRVVGQIKPHNVASEKVFGQLGFRLMPPTTINGSIAHQMYLGRQDLTQLQD